MKKFLLAVAALLCASGVAMAGPNAGGTLILVEAVGVDYTDSISNYCGMSTITDCATGVVEAGLGEVKVLHAIAAFAPDSSPRLKGITFGIGYDPGAADFEGVILAGNGKCADLEVPTTSPAWPDSGSGNALTWAMTQTAHLVEVYWFAAYGYSYSGANTFSLCLIPHPTQPTQFGDDDVPASLDDIAGLGCYGFGEPGFLPCPSGEVPGACCFADGSCTVTLPADCTGDFDGSPSCSPNPCPQPATGACCIGEDCFVRTEAECTAAGGEYKGDDVSCDPNPCIPIPTIETTWGQIKSNYR
jgi:hypothetical protein